MKELSYIVRNLIGYSQFVMLLLLTLCVISAHSAGQNLLVKSASSGFIAMAFVATGGDILLDSKINSKVVTIVNKGTKVANLSSITVIGKNLRLKLLSCKNNSKLQVGGSCTIVVSLINSEIESSGVGHLDVIYDNGYNNQATLATSNISWNTGASYNLTVTFSQPNLFALANHESSIRVILQNKGSKTLNNIIVPDLAPGLSWDTSDLHSCNIYGNQSLYQNIDCTLLLGYTPVSNSAGHLVVIDPFKSSNGYATEGYSITQTSLGNLELDTSNNFLGGFRYGEMVNANIFNVSIANRLPITNHLSGYAKLGVGYGVINFAGSEINAALDERFSDMYSLWSSSVGVSYAISNKLHIALENNQFMDFGTTDLGDINSVSFNLEYNF